MLYEMSHRTAADADWRRGRRVTEGRRVERRPEPSPAGPHGAGGALTGLSLPSQGPLPLTRTSRTSGPHALAITSCFPLQPPGLGSQAPKTLPGQLVSKQGSDLALLQKQVDGPRLLPVTMDLRCVSPKSPRPQMKTARPSALDYAS